MIISGASKEFNRYLVALITNSNLILINEDRTHIKYGSACTPFDDPLINMMGPALNGNVLTLDKMKLKIKLGS